MQPSDSIRRRLLAGAAIPASPLALDARRRLDERRQRALWRYYAAAGAGGIAIGVHTTQFAIRDPKVGLYEPLLALAAEEFDRADANNPDAPLMRIAGLCGQTEQAVAEAALACRHGFHAGLLSLGAMRDADEPALLAHCRSVAAAFPIIGFYLQPAVGGRVLPYDFWRRFLEIPGVVAIKVAPFNRYQTLDVLRAVAESGRTDIALYTGNDDNIVLDLVAPYAFRVDGADRTVRFVGGLLGHWAVWTRSAVQILERCQAAAAAAGPLASEFLRLATAVTEMNAAVFDVANNFAGCIAGVHEVLRRQGLLEGIWCLDPNETLGPGQREALDRVVGAYPDLVDDAFVAEHRDEWLGG